MNYYTNHSQTLGHCMYILSTKIQESIRSTRPSFHGAFLRVKRKTAYKDKSTASETRSKKAKEGEKLQKALEAASAP